MSEKTETTCSVCGEATAGDDFVHTERGPVCDGCRTDRVVEGDDAEWEEVGKDASSSRATYILWSVAIGSLAVAGLLWLFPSLLPESVRIPVIVVLGLIGAGTFRATGVNRRW